MRIFCIEKEVNFSCLERKRMIPIWLICILAVIALEIVFLIVLFVWRGCLQTKRQREEAALPTIEDDDEEPKITGVASA